MTLRTLNYGNHGIFLITGNAGFCPSTVEPKFQDLGFGHLELWGREIRYHVQENTLCHLLMCCINILGSLV